MSKIDYTGLLATISRQAALYSSGPTKHAFLEAKEAIETLTRELAEARRKERLGQASIMIVGQLAATIPLDLVLDKTGTAGGFVDYFKQQLAERDTHRAELATTKARLAEAVEVVKFLMEMSEPPERNCSCHVSPPCRWCEEYAGITEAREYAETFLTKQGTS